jgi:hypothetical protein
MNRVAPIVAKPRLVKASDRAADREASLQHARELRAKRELSLNAILNRAVGCAPRNPRALFESLFEVAEG